MDKRFHVLILWHRGEKRQFWEICKSFPVFLDALDYSENNIRYDLANGISRVEIWENDEKLRTVYDINWK